MTRRKVAQYNGIAIVKHNDNWVAQLENSRIRPYDIGAIIEERNLTPEEVANNVYTHLTINKVRAAYQYYQENRQEMNNLKSLKDAIKNASQYKIYECTCGQQLQGVDGFKNHFDGESNPNHKIIQTHFQNISFECDCQKVLRSQAEIVDHLNIYPNHRLETVHNNFTETEN
jgi:uncharacterized protein (DUF433 family)